MYSLQSPIERDAQKSVVVIGRERRHDVRLVAEFHDGDQVAVRCPPCAGGRRRRPRRSSSGTRPRWLTRREDCEAANGTIMLDEASIKQGDAAARVRGSCSCHGHRAGRPARWRRRYQQPSPARTGACRSARPRERARRDRRSAGRTSAKPPLRRPRANRHNTMIRESPRSTTSPAGRVRPVSEQEVGDVDLAPRPPGQRAAAIDERRQRNHGILIAR